MSRHASRLVHAVDHRKVHTMFGSGCKGGDDSDGSAEDKCAGARSHQDLQR